jgi:hypothetical protein
LPYYWENSLDFLDVENEWYLNRDTKVLYYKPHAGTDINQLEIIYPLANCLFNIEGTASVPVRNVSVQNIEFRYGNWAAPSTVPGVRINQGVDLIDKNISVETLINVRYADKIHITSCNILCSGAYGVKYANEVHNSEITACHFDQICATAIFMNDEQRTIPCNDNRVAHNLIENFGLNYTNGVSLSANNSIGLIVENNEIRFGRYGGMQVVGGAKGIQYNNMIHNNNVHHVMQLHDDCGGIYAISFMSGTKIYQNWVHDIARGTWAADYAVAGIYLDNDIEYVTVEDNVLLLSLRGAQQTFEQVNIGAHDNTFRRNDSQDAGIIAASGPKIFPGVKRTASSSNDATLSSLTITEGILSPTFAANISQYTVYAGSELKTIQVSGIANDCGAIVSGNVGEVHLADGNCTLYITVMAPDGSTKTYLLNVSRDYTPELYQLKINDRQIAVADTIRQTIFCEESSVMFSPEIPQFCTSLILSDNQAVTMPFELKPGLNRFTIRVASTVEYFPAKDYVVEIMKALDIIRPYYDRVLAVNLNPATNGGFTFSDFQWKRNGKEIAGETGAYLYLPNNPIDTDEYTVAIHTNDGQTIPVCAKLGQILKQGSESTLRAFPNPAQSSVTVENTDWENVSDITLYNKTGVKLRMYPVSGLQTEINVSAYPSGTYILQSGNKSTLIIIK